MHSDRQPMITVAAGRALAVLRIAFGLSFLWAFIDKVFGGGVPARPGGAGAAAVSGGRGREPRYKSLTELERLILDEIAAGNTNRQIAQSMFLAEETVKS